MKIASVLPQLQQPQPGDNLTEWFCSLFASTAIHPAELGSVCDSAAPRPRKLAHQDFFDVIFRPSEEPQLIFSTCCFVPQDATDELEDASAPWSLETKRLAGFCKHERQLFHWLVASFGYTYSDWSHLRRVAHGDRLLPPWKEPIQRLVEAKGDRSLARYGNLLMKYLNEMNEHSQAEAAFSDGTPMKVVKKSRFLLSRVVALDLIRTKVVDAFHRGKPFHIDDHQWTNLALSWETSKWTPQDDMSLLIGILRYGWASGVLAKILPDKRLRLAERCQVVGIAANPSCSLDELAKDEGVINFLLTRFRLLCRSLFIERQMSEKDEFKPDEPNLKTNSVRQDQLRLVETFKQLFNNALLLCQSSNQTQHPAPEDIQILLDQTVSLQHQLSQSRQASQWHRQRQEENTPV